MRFNLQTINSNGFLDKTGAAVSWICAVHCLAMPFLFSVLPLFGLGFLAGEGFEYIFIGISVCLALMSILSDFFRFHRNINTMLLFMVGIGLVISADRIFEETGAGKIVFVIFGAGFITAAHLLNRYLCRKCEKCGKTRCRSSA